MPFIIHVSGVEEFVPGRRPMWMRSTVTIVVALAVANVAVGAHHSPSRFDQGREVTLRGVVTRVGWTNPHVSIYITVDNAGGDPVVWTVEAQSPRVMTLFGWASTSLARGDRVTVAAHPPRPLDAASIYSLS
jgi:hypothetical protein